MSDFSHLNILNRSILTCVNYVTELPKEIAIIAILGVALVVTFVLNVTCQIFLSRLEHIYAKRNKTLYSTIVQKAKKPLHFLIMLTGLLWCLQIVFEYHGNEYDSELFIIWSNGLIALTGWFMLRSTTAIEQDFLKRDNTDSITVMAIGRLSRLLTFILLTLMIMENFGFSISGLLAFGGVGGIAIGFAAKDLLANFFGGFMLFVDRPFTVGDWIRSPDRQIEGIVEKMGWRMTCIRTFEKRPLYVPNSTFISISVENPSRMQNRRIYEYIGIRYSDMANMEKIVVDIKSMLKTHPEIDSDEVIIVSFEEFADSCLNIMVYAYTRTTKWVHYYEVKQEILLLIKDIVYKYGADFAFPTQQLYITQTNDDSSADSIDSDKEKEEVAEKIKAQIASACQSATK